MIRAFVSTTKPTEQRKIGCDPGDVYFFWEFAGLYFHGTASPEEATLLTSVHTDPGPLDLQFRKAMESLVCLQKSLKTSGECMVDIGARIGIIEAALSQPPGGDSGQSG